MTIYRKTEVIQSYLRIWGRYTPPLSQVRPLMQNITNVNVELIRQPKGQNWPTPFPPLPGQIRLKWYWVMSSWHYWDCGATRLISRTSVEAVNRFEMINLDRETFLDSSSSSALSVLSDTLRFLLSGRGAESELLKNQLVGKIFESFFLVEVPFVFSLEEVRNMPGSFTEKLWSLFFLHPLCSRSSWLQVKCLLESKLWAKSSFSKKSANEEFRLWPSPKVEEFFLLLVEIGRLSLRMFALLSALSNIRSSAERRACASAASRHLSIFCQSANMSSERYVTLLLRLVQKCKNIKICGVFCSFTASIFSLTTFQFLNLTTVDQMWWKLSRRAKSLVSHFICASIDCKYCRSIFQKDFKYFKSNRAHPLRQVTFHLCIN